MLSPKPSGTVDNMTIVCEEEGISMVTTIEEVSFPLRHADNSVEGSQMASDESS